MTVSQKVQIVTFDQGPSLSDVTVKSLLTDSTVTGGTADSCPEIATDAGVYVAEFVNADAAALIPAGTYRLRAVIGGAPLNRYVTLKGVDGEVAYSTDVPPASSSGISVANVTKSLDDTGPITFSWPVTGAVITAQVSIDNGLYQAAQGTFAFLRTDEPGIHYYTLSFDADDRPTAEGTARYKLIDGSGIRGYINLSMNVSSGGGGGDGAWTEEDVTYALEKLALLGVVADAVVVPAGTFMCGRGDIEQIFGTTAVAKWGDLNNNEDADEITGRINYRIAIADSFMRSTLGNSAWVLPLEGDEIPPILAYYTACLAGVLLYEGRGVQDYDARGNAQHQLSFHKKGVDDFVKGVLFGAVSLAPLEYNVASAAPEAT